MAELTSDGDTLPAPFWGAFMVSRRERRVVFTAVASATARLIQLASAAASVPVALRYLGSERYGLWATVTSVFSMLAFADLGIGNGLINSTAVADSKDDRDAARRVVSTAFFLLLGVGILITVVLGSGVWVLPSHVIFNVRTELARSESTGLLIALLGCFALSVPLGAVEKVNLGLQEGFVNHLWQAFGSALTVSGLLVAVHLGAGLPAVALAATGGGVIGLMSNTLVQFTGRRRWLRPSLRAYDSHTARMLAATGALFFAAQFGTAVLLGAPSVVISRLFGPAHVVAYSIAMKPAQALSLLTVVWAAPLWPAYAEANARGDHLWIRRTLVLSVLAGLGISCVTGLVYCVMHQWLFATWVGVSHAPGVGMVIAATIFLLAHSVRWTASMYLNGIGRIRGQVIYQTAFALCAICAAVCFANSFGATGVAFSFAIAEVAVGLCLLVESAISLRRSHPPMIATGRS